MFSPQQLRAYNSTPNNSRVMHMHINKPAVKQNVEMVSKPTATTTVDEESRKRTAWGTHIWLFLHTISVQIREDAFPVVGQELLRLIQGIVTNLPCPICSDHARGYVKNINFAAIQNKEQFINFIYQFHNSVNSRKGYPIYKREDVEPTYAKAVLPNIYRNFETAYKDKSFNPSHIHDEFVRNRILTNMRSWMQRNNGVFVQG